MNETWVMVPFKQKIDLTKPNEAASIDVNETNINAVNSNGNCLRVDTSKLREIHTIYTNKA